MQWEQLDQMLQLCTESTPIFLIFRGDYLGSLFTGQLSIEGAVMHLLCPLFEAPFGLVHLKDFP